MVLRSFVKINLLFCITDPLKRKSPFKNYMYVLFDCSNPKNTVNVLIFWTLVAFQNDLYKQCRPRSDCFWRSSLIRVFPVCYSAKRFFWIPALKTNILFENRKRKVLEILEYLPYLQKNRRDCFTFITAASDLGLHCCPLSHKQLYSFSGPIQSGTEHPFYNSWNVIPKSVAVQLHFFLQCNYTPIAREPRHVISNNVAFWHA